MMKLTLFAIRKTTYKRNRSGAVYDQTDLFWTGEDFESPRIQGPKLYSSKVEAELALADATDAYGPEGVEIVDASIEI